MVLCLRFHCSQSAELRPARRHIETRTSTHKEPHQFTKRHYVNASGVPAEIAGFRVVLHNRDCTFCAPTARRASGAPRTKQRPTEGRYSEGRCCWLVIAAASASTTTGQKRRQNNRPCGLRKPSQGGNRGTIMSAEHPEKRGRRPTDTWLRTSLRCAGLRSYRYMIMW